jgi:DNA-binding MltR family transcriptional regulator
MSKRLSENAAWPELLKFKNAPTNDRADVLVLSSILEHSLESAISGHFVTEPDEIKKLYTSKTDSPLLGTFSAKITLGYHLGIYPKWIRNDLGVIKDIRNAFAHSVEPLNFDNSDIIALCNDLSTAKIFAYKGAYLEGMAGQPSLLYWEQRQGKEFYHRTKEMDKSSAHYAALNIEYLERVKRGPPLAESLRGRFWVAANLYFSYFTYADETPLRYRTSHTFQMAIIDAEPPSLPAKNPEHPPRKPSDSNPQAN